MTSTRSWALQMNWVFISLILLTVGQTAVCGFGFTMLISYVGRAIFLLRAVGTVVPFKVSVGFEAAHLFLMCVGIIFTKSGVDWLNALFTLLFCAAVCLLYIIDTQFYLYVVADDEDEDREDGTIP